MVNNKRKAAAEKAVATKAAKRAQKGAKHPPTTTTVTTSNPTPAANANLDAAVRRRGVMKQLCDCEQHKGLNEFEQFPISGDVLIPACAFRCPYCTYACSSKGHKGSTVRKHVRNMHIKTGHYPSLQMAQGSSGHPHHRLEKVVDLPPADESEFSASAAPAVSGPMVPFSAPVVTSGPASSSSSNNNGNQVSRSASVSSASARHPTDSDNDESDGFVSEPPASCTTPARRQPTNNQRPPTNNQRPPSSNQRATTTAKRPLTGHRPATRSQHDGPVEEHIDPSPEEAAAEAQDADDLFYQHQR